MTAQLRQCPIPEFKPLMQGEQRMRVELNIEERLSEEEHLNYLMDSIDMFIRAYAV